MQAPKPLIYILASVGGLVDAVGFLVPGRLFTAYMSGNSAALGAYFAEGHWSWGIPHLFAIPVFVLGIAAGGLLAKSENSLCPTDQFPQAQL